MQINLFDARMLTPLVSYLEQNGARSEAYLDRARIPGELIEEGGWIGKKQAYDFTFDVVNRSRCREAIFAAYLEFQMEHLGPIAEAMRSCRTVKESLEVGARLGSTAYEGNEYFLEIEGETTWFCYREPHVVSPGQTFINDMTLAVYYHLINATIDEDWRPEKFRVRGELIDRHCSLEIFKDCQASIHRHSTGLAFPTEFLSRRIEWNKPDDAGGITDWKLGPEGSEPVVDSMYRLIHSQFSFRPPPTLQEAAMMVDVSPRTLTRMLSAAGTSYRGILDRIRFDQACELLSVPNMSIKEVAIELGYSGTNNFVRSFRRMTGLTPGEYRVRDTEINIR